MDFEINRKIFHCVSLLVPLLYLLLPKPYMILVLAVFTALVLYIDIYRHKDQNVADIVEKIFGMFIREQEATGTAKLSGASFMMLGFFITAILFEKGLTITSWLILIVSDTAAALVGMKIGKPLTNGKSFEGSMAFLVSTILIAMVSSIFIGYTTSFMIIIVSSICTTFAEYHAKTICNDNLLIPITYCVVTLSLSFLFI